MLFPSCEDPTNTSFMYFLAEISVRSLVNRVHCSINFTDSIRMYTGALPNVDGIINRGARSSLCGVCDELIHQLDTWYNSLPPTIKPDLTPPIMPDNNIQSCLLRCRYWSTMNKIYRPFVIQATSMPEGSPVPEYLVEKSKKCIKSCRMYVKCARGLLAKRSPYVYTASHG